MVHPSSRNTTVLFITLFLPKMIWTIIFRLLQSISTIHPRNQHISARSIHHITAAWAVDCEFVYIVDLPFVKHRVLGRLWPSFGLPLAVHLAPFGHLGAPFGSRWGALGHPLDTPGVPLAMLGHLIFDGAGVRHMWKSLFSYMFLNVFSNTIDFLKGFNDF